MSPAPFTSGSFASGLDAIICAAMIMGDWDQPSTVPTPSPLKVMPEHANNVLAAGPALHSATRPEPSIEPTPAVVPNSVSTRPQTKHARSIIAGEPDGASPEPKTKKARTSSPRRPSPRSPRSAPRVSPRTLKAKTLPVPVLSAASSKVVLPPLAPIPCEVPSHLEAAPPPTVPHDQASSSSMTVVKATSPAVVTTSPKAAPVTETVAKRSTKQDRVTRKVAFSPGMKIPGRRAIGDHATEVCNCGKPHYLRKHDKNRHMLSHNTDPALRPMKCDVKDCPRTFNQWINKKSHMLSVHSSSKFHCTMEVSESNDSGVCTRKCMFTCAKAVTLRRHKKEPHQSN